MVHTRIRSAGTRCPWFNSCGIIVKLYFYSLNTCSFHFWIWLKNNKNILVSSNLGCLYPDYHKCHVWIYSRKYLLGTLILYLKFNIPNNHNFQCSNLHVYQQVHSAGQNAHFCKSLVIPQTLLHGVFWWHYNWSQWVGLHSVQFRDEMWCHFGRLRTSLRLTIKSVFWNFCHNSICNTSVLW